MADVEIPRRVWSAWIPAVGQQELRRALTAEERTILVQRRDALAPAVAPYLQADLDRVTLALADMFGGYTSMRHTDEDAVGKIDSTSRMLRPFPAWAIEKACTAIHRNGVFRDGKFDRRWPPNDSEIVAAVEEALRFYGDQHRQAVALLEATVEAPASIRDRADG